MVITSVIIAVVLGGYLLWRWSRDVKDEAAAPAPADRSVTTQGGGGPLNPEK